MKNEFGPWATSIDVGRRPQLSAFWRRRMTMLVPTSNASPRLAWHHLLWLGAVAFVLFATPTLRSSSLAAAEEGNQSDKGKDIKPSASDTDSKFRKMYTTTGTTSTGISGQRLDEIKKLIADKKYKFVSTFDSPDGEKQYVYSFALSDGSHAGMNFSMPLEKVASWDDYEKKQMEQRERRREKIKQAIVNARFRLLNVDVMQSHLCRDAKSGQTFKIQRVVRPDGKDIAYPRLDYETIPPSVTQTSWREHLRAIRDGKRDLLEMETVNSYTYEMSADDGTNAIFNYGGGEPLTNPAAKKKWLRFFEGEL